MLTTSAQRHTLHASSTRDATYPLFAEFDSLARFEVEECACVCNGNALVHPMALLKTLGDLPLHSVADAFVAVLLPARQNKKSPQLPSSTHQVNFCHAAVALQALSKQTTAHISQIVVTLHRTPLHALQALSFLSHSNPYFTRIHASRHAPSPSSRAPAHQVDLLQVLESAEDCAERRNVGIFQLLQRVV